MEYTKSELEEMTYNAEVNLDHIKDTGDGIGLMEKIDEEIPFLNGKHCVMASIRIEAYIDKLSQLLPLIKD